MRKFIVWLILWQGVILLGQNIGVKEMLSFPHRRDCFLIRFHPKTREFSRKQIFYRFSAVSQRPLPGVEDLYLVKLAPRSDLSLILHDARKIPEVMYAEPDYLRKISLSPNDPEYLGGNMWGIDKIGCPNAWNQRTDGVSVAIIDTGIQYTHPDLASNIWTNDAEKNGSAGVDDDSNGYIDDIYGYDFVNGDSNPDDDHGHGTHVAGTIGAIGNNNQGVVGICWTTKLMALKIFTSGGSGPVSAEIEAINYAVSKGIKVINMSLGGPSYSQSEKDAIDNAGAAGVITIIAAGNAGKNNDQTPEYPASYTSSNIIAVAASLSSDNLAGFSNYGRVSVDLSAPGFNIRSTYRGSSYVYFSGTSMATPHVAGSVALLWKQRSNLTYQQIIKRILDSVDIVTNQAGKTTTEGRLNLNAAIQDPQQITDFGKSSGGCSWGIIKGPDDPNDIIGYFIPFLLLLAYIYSVRKHALRCSRL